MTSSRPVGSSATTETSRRSRRKRCDGPLRAAVGAVDRAARGPAPGPPPRRPASFASPSQAGGSSEPLCSAKRGSRARSSRLARLPHRADPQLAVGEPRLGARDARRAVAPDRGQRLVHVGVEARAHPGGELRRRGFELGPARHGRDAGAPRRRRPAGGRTRSSGQRRRSGAVPDRLRELIDLVVASLDDPAADGRALAGRAHFSRDHLDRLLAGATGESPVALRRRLLLERAAWQLRTGAIPASEAALAAGYGSAAAFSRAFARAHGVPPAAFADSGRPVAARRAERHPLPPAGGPAAPGRAARRGARRRPRPRRPPGHAPPRARPRAPGGGGRARAGGARPRAAARVRRGGVRGPGADRRAHGGAARPARSRSGSRRSPARSCPTTWTRARAGDLLARFDAAGPRFARLVRAAARPRRVGRRLRRRARASPRSRSATAASWRTS